MGALEAPLSSEPWFRDWLTLDLLLHLPPLLTGQQEVHMLGGDIFTVGILVDTEIYRKLMRQMTVRIKHTGDVYSVKMTFEGTCCGEFAEVKGQW